ncbi:MAG TPA: twin-arginine translocation signal domain-containing protein, partial [Gordonia sp. (in: high G+C Gram-positive bacteria)]|nr:twin-arginine translocation signal domain-containing protein [Gordonia sp. (in: high G+C Gram-positive bacteria)]
MEKPQTTRRTFLKGAAAVGAGVAGAQFIPGVGPATGAPRVRTDRSEQRAIVIGSGFGGGVA